MARLGRRVEQPDPDADLAEVMRTEAVSRSVQARTLYGPHYLQHLRAFLSEDLRRNGFIAAQDHIAGGLPQRMGLAWRARLAPAAFAEIAWPVTAPTVHPGPVSPWHALAPDFIDALLRAPDIAALIASGPGPGTPPGTLSLLQALLRHALLREVEIGRAHV